MSKVRTKTMYPEYPRLASNRLLLERQFHNKSHHFYTKLGCDDHTKSVCLCTSHAGFLSNVYILFQICLAGCLNFYFPLPRASISSMLPSHLFLYLEEYQKGRGILY